MPSTPTRFIALALAVLVAAVSAADGATDIYGPGAGFVIPDNDPDGASSSIIVTAAGLIEDLDLILDDMSHTWLGDLVITLTHVDSGASWNVSNRAGQLEGGNEQFGFDIDLNGVYIIDDESTSGSFHDQISLNGGVLPPGDYNSLDSLSNFDGLEIAGTWTLSISDSAGGDTGELGSWSLRVETTSEASMGLVLVFEEAAAGVTGTLSGSLDLANAVAGSVSGVSAAGARVNPPSPFISTGSLEGVGVDSFLLSSAPVFGPGEASSETLTLATSFSGDFFSLTDEIAFVEGELVVVPAVYLPDGYVSGTALSATMFFADATFDSLGITPGTYIYPLLQDPANVQPSEGSSVCASGLTSKKVITVTFGQAPVTPFEDCIFSSGFEP